MKSKRAKATDISMKVKQEVWERDGHQCIICGNPVAMPNAHYISRAHGGLGIPQNVVTLCTMTQDNKTGCHHKFDNGSAEDQERIGAKIKTYLQSIYPDWNEADLVYDKYK